jgi:3' terminal RNA ribose 2'-O-methyltransferase Hen1
MILSITTTYRPATDLGYLLYKHPARCQTFDISFGRAHVFFPEATPERCTAALLLDIDPVGLVRGNNKRRFRGHVLQQYVNDRPFVASSFLSTAMVQVYRTAMTGRCKDRPELAATPIPLEAGLAVVPDASRGELLRRLFEPLGYEVTLTGHPLDERFPGWGESPYLTVTLRATLRLSELLTHIYVLVPVLDNDKHYWVGESEVEKLLDRGKGWLAGHPERKLIANRYLRYQRSLTRTALNRLLADDAVDPDGTDAARAERETRLEKPLSLNEQRLNSVLAVLKSSGAKRVLDLGCGEGRLLQRLMREKQFAEIAGLDVSFRALEIAGERLHLDRLSPAQRERVKLWHGSLIYRDARLEGFDAAAVVEVIEHLDPARLAAFERVVFERAHPGTVVITTPNVEYNAKFPTLPAGQFRHQDHRFEWSRAEFERWATGIADRFGYTVRFLPVGPKDPSVGAPSQMGVFTR